MLSPACTPKDQDVEKRAPITVKYEIPYFTVSGIQVRYLKIVEKSGYQALPWVRYITQNGDDYRCRISFFYQSMNMTQMVLLSVQFTDGIGEGQCPHCADVVVCALYSYILEFVFNSISCFYGYNVCTGYHLWRALLGTVVLVESTYVPSYFGMSSSMISA
jgi:hypothetical protein